MPESQPQEESREVTDRYSARIDELLLLLRHFRLHQLSSGFSDYIDPEWEPDRKIDALESRIIILENQSIEKWNEVYALEKKVKEREARLITIETEITQRLEFLKSLDAGIANQEMKISSNLESEVETEAQQIERERKAKKRGGNKQGDLEAA